MHKFRNWILSFAFSIFIVFLNIIVFVVLPQHKKIIVEGVKKTINVPRYQDGTEGCLIVLPSRNNERIYNVTVVAEDEKPKIYNFTNLDHDRSVAIIPSQEAGNSVWYYFTFDEHIDYKGKASDEKAARLTFKNTVHILVKMLYVVILVFFLLFSNISGLYTQLFHNNENVYVPFAFVASIVVLVFSIIMHGLEYGATFKLLQLTVGMSVLKALVMFGLWLTSLILDRREHEKTEKMVLASSIGSMLVLLLPI